MSVIDPASGEVVPDNAVQPFPNPGEAALDHAAEAASYIERQYRDAARLQATIAGIAAFAQNIENCLVSISPLDDPAVAGVDNLTVTGELVGQSRVLTDGTAASDTNLRTYIAMRIVRNSSHGTDPEFIAALRAFLGAASIAFHYYNLGDMTIVIEIGTGSAPSADVVSLLDGGPVPRAMAVGVLRDYYDPVSYFAFDDDTSTGAKGFGEIGDPTVGGGLAEIF